MAVISVPVCIIRKTYPYLERFYGFSYRYIQRYIESTCSVHDDNRMNLLPKFWMYQNLDRFPDDFGIIFDLPYYKNVEALQEQHDFLAKHELIFHTLLLAPLMSSVFHPYTDEDNFVLQDEAERQEVLRVYEFLQQMQKDGFDPSKKYLLSYGGTSSVQIPNTCNWLLRMIEKEYRSHYDALGNPPRHSQSREGNPPKRRPTFASFLGYNTLLFLRDYLRIRPTVPQGLCQFISDYLTACSDIVSKQDLSYKNTYNMLQNCKKTYGMSSIPISWVKE